MQPGLSPEKEVPSVGKKKGKDKKDKKKSGCPAPDG
jgi:hypothetical protein